MAENTFAEAKPKKYLLIYLLISFGICWGMCLFYVIANDFMTRTFGELTLENPLVLFALNVPGVATFLMYFLYGGWKAVKDFLKTLIPRVKDLKWIPIIIAVMCIYLVCVRLGCMAVGIKVPELEYTFPQMLKIFLLNFFGETGMIGQVFGWFGFMLPYMQAKTKSNIRAGLWTGFAFGMFLLPGYVFSSFETATAFPFYLVQMMLFSVCATYVLNEVKGNLLFFLLTFWIAATGSKVRLYDFIPSVQIVQIVLFLIMFGVLYFVFKKRYAGKKPEEVLQMFPDFLYQGSRA